MTRNREVLETTHCDNCGETEASLWFVTGDNTNGLPGTFRVVRCRGCGLCYLSPRPSQDAIGSYYEDEYYTQADGSRFKPMAEVLVRWFRGQRSRVVNRCRNGGRVLDVGSDRGTFLSLMREHGWEVHGTQVSSTAVAAAKARYGIDLRLGDLCAPGFPADYFDVVTLWHVLEHVRAPSAYLREIARILKPGGVVIIEVPDAGSWQARVFKERWLLCEAPRHLYFFDEVHLRELLSRNHLDVVAVHRFSLEMGPLTMLQSLMNLLFKNENDLFNMLKSRRIAHRKQRGALYTAGYLLVAAVLAPVSFMLSVLLAAAGSGEIVRLTAIRRLVAESVAPQLAEEQLAGTMGSGR